jgi:uncharacterized glyoxalase superfamily protein PhnB
MGFAMQALTPLLIVDRIEPCLDFWTRLGFQTIVGLPEDGHIGFVILRSAAVEVMYQSRASVAKDIPVMAELPCSCVMYIKVTDLDGVIEKLGSAEVVQEKRVTFYGATEYWVREPGGNVIGFAEMATPDV